MEESVKAKSLHKKSKREGYRIFLYALPTIIFVLIFSYLPLRGWIYSIYNYQPGLPVSDCEFVGMKYFTKLFSNPVMRMNLFKSLRNTFAMVGLGILTSPLPMLFAIFLSEMRSKGFKKFVQTVTTMPHFISWIIMYFLVFSMLNVNNGFVNTLLVQMGIIEKPINFLASQKHVWVTMKGYELWKELGWSAIVYLAAIAGIDQELYEAAMVDGANRLQRIWHITVPGMIETFFVLLIMSLGNFLNTGMEQYYVFQNAMNKDYIQVLDLYVYNIGIGNGQISYATAIGIMKSLVAVIMFGFVNWLSKAVRGYSMF